MKRSEQAVDNGNNEWGKIKSILGVYFRFNFIIYLLENGIALLLGSGLIIS
jgi:hypothetical protein